MPSQATANAAVVLGGLISMPRVGAWSAELDVDVVDAKTVTGAITLKVDDLEWKGTSVDVGTFSGRVHVRMVGGAAGLGKATKPRFYHAMPARTAVEEVLADGGEKLSSTSDASKLSTILPLWTRAEGIVSEAFEQIVDELGATWRILPDGTIWVGTETWGDATAKDVVVLVDAPHEQRIEFGSATPSLRPGTTFQKRRVSRVEVHLAPKDIHTKAWFEDGASEVGGDVIRVALERLVRQATKHVDWFGTYGGKVVSQNGDGTLELRLDSSRLPGMSRVPIRAGSLTLKVKQGAEVNIVFRDGSPAKPCVTYVDPKGLLEAALEPTTLVTTNAVQVVTQNGRPLARVGDMVQVISTPPGTPAIGQIMTGNNMHRG